MTKAELIEQMANDAGISKAAATTALNSMIDGITKSLKKKETPNITLHRRTRVTGMHGKEHLEEITWRDDAAGTERRRPIRHVFSMAGAVPNTGWLRGCVALDDKGFVLAGSDLPRDILELKRWPLTRAPMLFETIRR